VFLIELVLYFQQSLGVVVAVCSPYGEGIGFFGSRHTFFYIGCKVVVAVGHDLPAAYVVLGDRLYNPVPVVVVGDGVQEFRTSVSRRIKHFHLAACYLAFYLLVGGGGVGNGSSYIVFVRKDGSAALKPTALKE